MLDRITCVFLANTADLNLYGMTQRAINTLRFSQPNTQFDIRVVETNKDYLDQGFVYDGCSVITPGEKFNYNRFLNFGKKDFQTEWLVVANNDVIFTKDWLTRLAEAKRKHPEVYSFSPWEPDWHKKRGMTPTSDVFFGYRTSYEITGWCLVMHRSVVEKCQLFDEAFKFWYQDNDYALSLQRADIKHALVTNSRVYHMVSGSHHLLTNENKHEMTDGQVAGLHNKWGKNV